MSLSVLDWEMFTEAEAARLLRVPQRTLNYWLEGGDFRGRAYRPVILTEPRGGHAAVIWAGDRRGRAAARVPADPSRPDGRAVRVH